MKKELEARTKRFALSVIAFVSKLPRGKASDVIGYQLVKSGTSIGANYREVNRAESHDDFIHKIAICEKEAAETELLVGTDTGGEFDGVDFNRRALT
jgi:four helix bundle protein